MKMSLKPGRHPRQGAFLTLVFLVFMGIMAILVAINSRQLLHLRRTTQLLERQQIQRLSSQSTSVPTTTNIQAK